MKTATLLDLNALDYVSALVVGDLMLDVYIHGKVCRISPEAPVPVVQVDHIDYLMGGAANVAANLHSLGCSVVLAGYLGKDTNGEILESKIDKITKEKDLIIKCDNSTICKTRILADGQHVVRYDEDCDFRVLSTDKKNEFVSMIQSLLYSRAINVILISDYNKGTITKDVMHAISQFKCPIICDIKPNNVNLFNGVFSVTPNLLEAKQISGSDSSDPASLAMSVKKTVQSKTVLLTMAEHGMLFLDENNNINMFDACFCSNYRDLKRRVDVTGAGDTVLSTFGAGIAARFSPKISAMLANMAAGVVVNKIGTATCTREELLFETTK